VYPPQLLIPLELLGWKPFPVHKIENTAVFFVPAIFERFERCLHRFSDQLRPVHPLAQVHDKPHCLDGVSRIHEPAVEGVGERAVFVYVFHDQAAQLGA